MSLAHLYHVPYSGNIERVSPDRANALSANDNAEVSRIYHVQTARLGDMIDYARGPAVAGGLIVRCPAEKVQDIYDAVFGTSNKIKTANIIEFPQTMKQWSLQSAFGESAEKFRLRIDFPKASELRADNQSHTLEKTLDLDMAA